MRKFKEDQKVKKTASLLLIGLCTLLALLSESATGPTALAQDAGATGFDEADANHDGVINLEEWDQFSSRLFDGIDKDGDGEGSPEELGQAFETFDYNKDGVIDGNEAPLIIILGDDDGDGRVSRDEFDSLDWTRESIDANRDGRVSREEFGNARREVYDRADFDRSTTLGRSEYNAAPSLTLFRF
jgi:Ca2+-binding EF-hand superfamily protein